MEGSQIGKYRIDSAIGRGAAGVVYNGWDTILARRVAIKVLPLLGLDDEGQERRKRFLREAQAAAGLHHPNIVGVYDYGETDAVAFIAMELISGHPLDSLLPAGTILPTADVLVFMSGLLAGLQHSHERGVVHRDIKPSNVVATAGKLVKITDFGIAHLETSNMTLLGTVMGTPAYMSPEQVQGERVDARTDIYSAGVILYQMLLGRRPFEGGTASIMHKIVNTEPPLPPDLLADVSPDISDVLRKSLSKRVEDRYGSAAEFADAIRQGLGDIDASTSSRIVPRRSDDTVLTPPQSSTAPGLAAAPVPPAPDPAAGAARPSKAPGRRAIGLALAGLAVVVLGTTWWRLTLPRARSDAAGIDMPAAPQPFPASASQPAIVASAPPAATGQPDASAPAPERQVVANAQPAAAQPVASQPVASQPVASQPVAAQPVALEQFTAIDDAAAAIPCTLLQAKAGDRGDVVVNGLTALDGASEMQVRARLRGVVGQALPTVSVTWNLRHVDGPYCGVLDVLRPMSKMSAGSSGLVSLLPPTPPPPYGNTVELNTAGLEKSAVVTLDFYAGDHSVTHLAAGPANGLGASAAGGGVNASTGRVRMSAPGGAGLVVLIVSPRPLVSVTRPAHEAMTGYLEDLKAGLDQARVDGTRVATEMMVVQPTPR